jgi:hypothetical protein
VQDRLEHAAQRREQIDHLEPGGRDGDAAGFDLGQIEQVVDHFRQLEGRGPDELELLLLLVRQRAVELVLQDPRDALDGAERGAELVAHVGEEPALEIGRFAQPHGVVVELGVQREHALVRLGELRRQRRDLGLEAGDFLLQIGRRFSHVRVRPFARGPL